MDLMTIRGTIYGLACGDALGAPTEFMHVEAIRGRYGPAGIKDLSQTNGRYTDDTQMTIALAEGLLDAHALGGRNALAGVDVVMPCIAKRFVEWAESPENNRAPGMTCMAGCRKLAEGVPWRTAGVPGSTGCGAAMRVAPLGLVYRRDLLGEIARASAILTHRTDVAEQAAHAAALVVRALADGAQPNEVLEIVLGDLDAAGVDPRFRLRICRVGVAVAATEMGDTTPERVQRKGPEAWSLGEAWVADEAFACALYCFLLAATRGEGYTEAVRYGANTDGDSDSIACIAGSFAGALWGVGGRGVPEAWIERIEKSSYLAELCRRLHAISS